MATGKESVAESRRGGVHPRPAAGTAAPQFKPGTFLRSLVERLCGAGSRVTAKPEAKPDPACQSAAWERGTLKPYVGGRRSAKRQNHPQPPITRTQLCGLLCGAGVPPANRLLGNGEPSNLMWEADDRQNARTTHNPQSPEPSLVGRALWGRRPACQSAAWERQTPRIQQ